MAARRPLHAKKNARANYSSDENGEISWDSDDESGLSLDPAHNASVRILKLKRKDTHKRKIHKRNCNLDFIKEINGGILQHDTSPSIPTTKRAVSRTWLPSSVNRHTTVSVNSNEYNHISISGSSPPSLLCIPKNLNIPKSPILSSNSCNTTPLKCLNAGYPSNQYKHLNEIAVSPILITKSEGPVHIPKLDKSVLPQDKSTSIWIADEKNGFKEGDKLVSSIENNKEVLHLTCRPLSPVLSLKQNICTRPSNNEMIKQAKTHFEINSSSNTDSQIITECSQISVEIPMTQVDIIESRSPSQSQQSEVKITFECSSSSKNSTDQSSDPLAMKCEDSESRHSCKYKKDGLSDRLQILIKKQRNKICMWHHEKYLAIRSEFVPPYPENVKEFYITKINNDYNMYLLEALDLSNKSKCMILLNVKHEGSEALAENCFLKLYEPYKVQQTSFGNIFLNLCKFEFFM